MAMGSRPKQIWTLLLHQGFRVATLGLLCGLLGTLLLAQLTRQLDYSGNASLIPAFAASVALNLLIWMIASSLPASKASKLDPAIVLR
jgi:putative ABC transport system permease protein